MRFSATRLKTCVVEGCSKEARAKEMCFAHYQRWRARGTTERLNTEGGATGSCRIDGCEAPARTRGWCESHYKRWKKYGDPKYVEPVLPPLTEKRCSACGEVKPVEEFYVGQRGRGQRARCKRCFSAGMRVHMLRRKYGMEIDDYEALLEAQGGGCGACGGGSGGENFHVDHDHSCCPGTVSCGKCVRGLLCHICNRLLGLAGDDPVRLRGAVAYLERCT